MAEYLEREAVLQIINTVNEMGGFARYDDYSALFDEIDTMPSADVQPVRRGRWEDTISCFIDKLGAYYITSKCSCCSEWSDKVDDDANMSNEHCSHCGADMRNKEENENDTL